MRLPEEGLRSRALLLLLAWLPGSPHAVCKPGCSPAPPAHGGGGRRASKVTVECPAAVTRLAGRAGAAPAIDDDDEWAGEAGIELDTLCCAAMRSEAVSSRISA